MTKFNEHLRTEFENFTELSWVLFQHYMNANQYLLVIKCFLILICSILQYISHQFTEILVIEAPGFY